MDFQDHLFYFIKTTTRKHYINDPVVVKTTEFQWHTKIKMKYWFPYMKIFN